MIEATTNCVSTKFSPFIVKKCASHLESFKSLIVVSIRFLEFNIMKIILIMPHRIM